MGKRTKIKSKEGKKILGQIQNNKLPMYEKLIALQTQTSKLPPREKEAIENEFIKQINQDRTLAREGSLGSIQDIINKPGIIVKSIRNDTIDRMVFFKTTKRFFGPGGPFPLESLSEDQKTDLLEALNQSEVVFIEDLSQLPGFWADIEGEEMRIEFEKKKVIEEAMSLM